MNVNVKILTKVFLKFVSDTISHSVFAVVIVKQQLITTSGSAVVYSSPKYVVQRTRTKLAECAFSVAGPSAWNSLPADLRLDPNTAVFKRKLYKSRMFRSVFTQ